VMDTIKKKRHIVLPAKRIVGVENVVDEDEYNQKSLHFLLHA
jgi:hypothetical protein